MKSLLLLFSVLICSLSFSQDILVFKTGDEVKAKVLEVGTSEVKYKKADNLSGPTFTCTKAELFMIKYENGTKDVFNQTKTTQQQSQASTPVPIPAYQHKINVGAGVTVLGGLLLVSGAGMLGGAFQSARYGYGNVYGLGALAFTGIAFMSASVPFLIAGPIVLAKGIRMKRESTTTSLYITPTGFCMRF